MRHTPESLNSTLNCILILVLNVEKQPKDISFFSRSFPGIGSLVKPRRDLARLNCAVIHLTPPL